MRWRWRRHISRRRVRLRGRRRAHMALSLNAQGPVAAVRAFAAAHPRPAPLARPLLCLASFPAVLPCVQDADISRRLCVGASLLLAFLSLLPPKMPPACMIALSSLVSTLFGPPCIIFCSPALGGLRVRWAAVPLERSPAFLSLPPELFSLPSSRVRLHSCHVPRH